MRYFLPEDLEKPHNPKDLNPNLQRPLFRFIVKPRQGSPRWLAEAKAEVGWERRMKRKANRKARGKILSALWIRDKYGKRLPRWVRKARQGDQ